MSIYFVTSDGRDLWNPSSFTAQLFCDQAESIARHLGVDSGLGPIVSDAVVVSELSFVSFAQSFAVQLSQVDPESGAHVLLEGCFSIVGALAAKLGVEWSHHEATARLVSDGARLVG